MYELLNMNLLSFSHNDDNHTVHKVATSDPSRDDYANVSSIHVSKNPMYTHAKTYIQTCTTLFLLISYV